MVFLVTFCLLVLLASCAAAPTHLQVMAEEGLQLRKRTKFSSSPEFKVQVAQDLVVHAALYDHPMNRSTDSAYLVQAHRFQREEREAALALMREAAEDYMARQDTVRARSTYQAVASTFWDEGQRPICESAKSSFTLLNGLERELTHERRPWWSRQTASRNTFIASQRRLSSASVDLRCERVAGSYDSYRT